MANHSRLRKKNERRIPAPAKEQNPFVPVPLELPLPEVPRERPPSKEDKSDDNIVIIQVL
ncbi:hypothetical protein KKC32_00580 [Patescibacteria group bacterium]|nr:hypothetical protein [Patescibacteria group bacterium]